MTTPKYNKLLDSDVPPLRQKLIEQVHTPPWLQTTEVRKLRKALEEVAHLTTRVPIPEDGDVRGWEQVTVQRIAAIKRVVKTALEEGTE